MKTRQAGFTLFETLVAMTIMALLLGALMPIFQGGMKSLQFGSRQTQAALLAQAILNRALVEQVDAELVPPTVGVMDGLRWSIRRQPYRETELPAPRQASLANPQLWELSVAVEWSNAHQVILKGLAPIPADIAVGSKPGAS